MGSIRVARLIANLLLENVTIERRGPAFAQVDFNELRSGKRKEDKISLRPSRPLRSNAVEQAPK